MRKQTLYGIGEDLEALQELLFESDGEITDELAEAAIDSWFEENKEQLADKLDGYCAVIEEQQALADLRLKEAKRLSNLAQQQIGEVARLKSRLKEFFLRHEITKFETGFHKFSIAQNGGALPLILPENWLQDPASAPEQFHETEISLNRAAIRAHLESGGEIEGAALMPRGVHLKIK